MKWLHFYISILFPVFLAQGQTTPNLILNNDYEAINTASSLYQPSTHLALLRDTNFHTTPVPCWVYANFVSQIVNYDSFSVSSIPNAQLNSIYPQHKNRSLSFFTGSFFVYPISEINPPISLLETKLIQPLSAGITYRLTGYINGNIDSFVPNSAGSYPILFTHIKNLGINFSTNKLYFNNYNYAPNINPTLVYTIDSFTYQGVYNPWHKFTISYTALGGEQYLTMGNFDTTRANLRYYPVHDSILANYHPTWTYDSVEWQTFLYLDNLTLIPISDTSLTVINPHISDPDSILLVHDTLVCGGGALTLTTGAEYQSYIWSTGDLTRTTHITTPGTYTVTVDNGCAVYTDSITILPDTTLRAIPHLTDSTTCADVPVAYSLPSLFLADHIRWSSGDSTLTSSFTHGTHTVTVSNQCFTATDTFITTYTGSDTVHLFTDTVKTFCPGQAYTLAAGQSYTSYLWSSGAQSQSISVTDSGYYRLTVTDAYGCSITDQVHLDEPASPTVLLTDDTLRACVSAYPLSITAQPGFTQYVWNGVAGTDRFTVAVSDTRVIASGNTLCGIVSDTLIALSITEQTGLTLTVDSNCNENTATITAITVGSPSIQWDNASTAPQQTVSLPQNLIVTATYQCTVLSDTVSLPSCAHFVHTLYVPNAFSPNGDGTNDGFHIFGDKVNMKFLAISIFDRWGELVYQSNDIDFIWNGRYQGTAQFGVFVYDLSVVYTDEKAVKSKGSVTILR